MTVGFMGHTEASDEVSGEALNGYRAVDVGDKRPTWTSLSEPSRNKN